MSDHTCSFSDNIRLNSEFYIFLKSLVCDEARSQYSSSPLSFVLEVLVPGILFIFFWHAVLFVNIICSVFRGSAFSFPISLSPEAVVWRRRRWRVFLLSWEIPWGIVGRVWRFVSLSHWHPQKHLLGYVHDSRFRSDVRAHDSHRWRVRKPVIGAIGANWTRLSADGCLGHELACFCVQLPRFGFCRRFFV